MAVAVSVQTTAPRRLAAVRREVKPGQVAAAWGPALDQVWAFLRTRPSLRTDGHNVFVYEHPKGPGAPIVAHFGVEVMRTFEPAGEVRPVETPSGEAAVGVHVGSYDGLRATHEAIHAWVRESGRTMAGWSWEIYGNWSDDPGKLETTVGYLLG